MTVGESIRTIRLSKKMTQKQLGELAGIAEPTIRRYETGKLHPKLETIKKIADALNVHVFDLIGIGEKFDKLQANIIIPPDATPESSKSMQELNAKNPRELYNALSYNDKLEFWKLMGIFDRDLSPAKRHLIDQVKTMPESKIKAVLAFINSLNDIEKLFAADNKPGE